MQVRKKNNLIGTFKSISFIGNAKENYFSIKPIWPSLNPRIYDDNLSIKVKDTTLQIMNHVDFEKYIAGVIESEAGPTSELEFYKSQLLALIGLATDILILLTLNYMIDQEK